MSDDMNLNPDEESNLIILNDDEGNEVKFEFLDLIKYEEEDYVVLLPVPEDGEEDNEVVILKLESTESEDEELSISLN